MSNSFQLHGVQPARLLCPWIFQARILVWVAMSYSRGSSQSRNRTHVPCIGRGFFTTETPGKPHLLATNDKKKKKKKRGTSLVAQMVKNLHAMWETWLQSLSQEDPLEKGLATPPVILPREFHRQKSLEGYSPWLQRAGHGWVTNTMIKIYWVIHRIPKSWN